MNELLTPTEIQLHQKSRLLTITFADGERVELPYEYLRVFSPAASPERLVTGKEQVMIERIEPQGQYALRLLFSDGHDTGIYSWETLYQLGQQRQQRWADYLAQLAALGVEREAAAEGQSPPRIRLLYFSYFVKKLGCEAEEITLPAAVRSVERLVELQRRRRPSHAYLFQEGSFRVTVNKQFCEPFTLLEDGDEVAFVPSSPHPPSPVEPA